MKLVDVHAHLTDAKFDDVEDVILRAKENGVQNIICSAYDLSSSKKAVELAEKYENVFACVGIHPEYVEDFNDQDLHQLENLALSEKVVAIGEIGLDYYWVSDNKDLQKEVFEKQIDLANKTNLPIVVHCRDAIGDAIEILKNNKIKRESLLHCYSGSKESAKILSDLNFSFSFGGVVTFKNAKTAVEVVEFLPIEKILLETDCPYMSPEPFRGKRNEPKNVVYVADKISKIKGLSIEAVAENTTRNAKRIFKI